MQFKYLKMRLKYIRNAGFTLIELLVTVAIIAIIAALALPTYDCYVERSQRNTAIAMMTEGTQFLERFFTVNNGYGQTQAGGAIALPVDLTVSPRGGSTIWYDVSLQAVAASTYVIQAVPRRASGCTPQCGTLTINEQQVRAANASTAAATVDGCFNR